MPPFRRWLAMLCALGAAALYAIAVQGSVWWSIGDEVGIGPVSSRHCFGTDGCQQGGLAWAGGTDAWVKAGAATYAAGLVAALVLVALAGALAARSSGRIAALSAGVATITAAVVAVTFIVNRPAVPGSVVARGQLLFAIALVLGAVAVVSTLWRSRRAARAS